MAINFPSSPVDEQTYTDPGSGNIYKFHAALGVWRMSPWISSFTGPTGYTGWTGPQGGDSVVTGPTGWTGPQGGDSVVTGPTGWTGPAGSQGADSTVTGPTGWTGWTGPTGAMPVIDVYPQASVSGAVVLDRHDGECQRLSVTGNVTSLTINNFGTSGTLERLVLEIWNTGAYTFAWPAGTKWPSGAAPTLSSGAGKKDVIMLVTVDAGTTVYGNVIGMNYV